MAPFASTSCRGRASVEDHVKGLAGSVMSFNSCADDDDDVGDNGEEGAKSKGSSKLDFRPSNFTLWPLLFLLLCGF